MAVVVFGVLIIKFLPEKSFLSLEYLTIGEEVVFLLVLSVLVFHMELGWTEVALIAGARFFIP